MRMRQLGIGILFFSALVCAPAFATDIGDAAPPLKIADWAKGSAVDLASGKGKNIYVVEFWATWCGPCRKSIPHLTEVQKKYKDKGVVVIGVSDEDAATVKPFVEKMGDKMDYVVAVDAKAPAAEKKSGGEKKDAKDGDDGEAERVRTVTNEAYMGAFDFHGIPTAFIVDKEGRVAWAGHPMDGMDEALDQIVAGKYDLAAAKKADTKRRDEQRAAMKINSIANEYFTLITTGGDAKKARELGDEFLKLAGTNGQLLNEFAWTLLTNESIKSRDMELAMKAAKAAYDASEGKDAAIVDTYARALFDTGKVKEAIEQQKKAIGLVKDNEEMLSDLKETLKRYEKSGKEG